MGLRGERAVGEAEPAQPSPVPVMYVCADGTGVPMMRGELEGRKGRQPDGSARTREVKLGCVFTQHGADAEGCPLRDPSSTTYLGTLQNAADFGQQLRQEAIRRGPGSARMRGRSSSLVMARPGFGSKPASTFQWQPASSTFITHMNISASFAPHSMARGCLPSSAPPNGRRQ